MTLTPTTPDEPKERNALRDILNCACSYTEEYNGLSYNIKTDDYEPCSCVEQLPKLDLIIANKVREARIEELQSLSDEMQEYMDAFTESYKKLSKKGSGVEGLAPGLHSNVLGRKQAKRIVEARLTKLREETHEQQ